MANKNIQMKHSKSGEWDNLYPISLTGNIFKSDGTVLDDIINDMTNSTNKNENNIQDLKNNFNQFTSYVDMNLKGTFNGIVDVTRNFNIKGNNTDETELIQQAFKLADTHGKVRLHFPDGIYRITKPIRVYKNTTVVMSENAVFLKGNSNLKVMFINGVYNDLNYSTGYSGDGNIHFKGGYIDGNVKEFPVNSNEYGTVGFALIHGNDISIENTTFQNFINNHVLEVNGCKNVKIYNCYFNDILKSGNFRLEVIQIDFSKQVGIPYIGAHDGTVCKNIEVNNCIFNNTPSTVGSHSSYLENAKQILHENISITNCKMNNISEYAIRGESWFNYVISGNIIDKINNDGIHILSSYNGVISNNVLNNGGGHGVVITNNTIDGVEHFTSELVIIGNVITGMSKTGVRLNTVKRIDIKGNTISKIIESGISVADSEITFINDNTIFDVNRGKTFHYGIFIIDSIDSTVSNNKIYNKKGGSKYNYAIGSTQDTFIMKVYNNDVEKGIEGAYNIRSTDIGVKSPNVEYYLTNILNAKTDTVITLNKSIENMKMLYITTGNVGGGKLITSLIRGWYKEGFRIGDKYVIQSFTDKTVFEIVSHTQIKVISTSDDVRYIVGVE